MTSFNRFLSLSLLLLWWMVHPSVAGSATIDDTNGDSHNIGRKPIYIPDGNWRNQSCEECIIPQNVRSQAFQGTWHTAQYIPNTSSLSIIIYFEGISIDVYFILGGNSTNSSATDTFAEFFVDGNKNETFSRKPDPNKEFLFSQKVFSISGLENKEHKLEIVTRGIDHTVWTTFDFAEYFFLDEKPSLAPGTIAGIVGGVMLVPTVIGILIFIVIRLRRRFGSHITNEKSPSSIFAPQFPSTAAPTMPGVLISQRIESSYSPHPQKRDSVVSPPFNSHDQIISSEDYPDRNGTARSHHSHSGLDNVPRVNFGDHIEKSPVPHQSLAAHIAATGLLYDASRLSAAYDGLEQGPSSPLPALTTPNPSLAAKIQSRSLPSPPVKNVVDVEGARIEAIEDEIMSLRVMIQRLLRESSIQLHHGMDNRGLINILRDRLQELERQIGYS